MTDHTKQHTTTLVLGGTGKTGRRVADRLQAGGRPVRIGSRGAATPFAWEDRTTWEPALRGISAAYVAYYPDLAVPGAADTIGAFAEQAAAAGVTRIVLLSGRGEEEALRAEGAVQAVGVDTTVVRCSFFAQNFSEGAWCDDVLAGVVGLPVGDVREPFVDADDIADVAVAALVDDGHAGEVYELTGPRLLTFAEAVAEIASASAHDVRFEPLTPDEYRELLAHYEVPEDIAWLLTYLCTEVLDGRNASLTDGVQRALGREPRDFADYARRTAATGVWSA